MLIGKAQGFNFSALLLFLHLQKEPVRLSTLPAEISLRRAGYIIPFSLSCFITGF
jgi:hypothetical protein